jgi:hypothetical protein
MIIPVDLMIHIIKTSEQCREYLKVTYPYEYEVYIRFSMQNGDQCAFSRAALRRVFNFELKNKGQTFLCALGSQSWGDKQYEESEKT